MKTVALTTWKWVAVSVLLAAVGGLLILGLGRTRGTRSYRWRMALWSLALALITGGVMGTAGCADSGRSPADAATLSDQGDGTMTPDVPVMCYAPRRPEDLRIMCYEDVQPVPDSVDTPDEMIMCYEPMPPDVSPADTVEPPDVQVTCYAPLPPDQWENDAEPEVQHQQDAVIMCYDPLPPDLVAEKDVAEEDVPMPTCYAPPPR